MTFFQAIIMGLVQGITEFLPISSSGHLVLMKHLLKMNMDTGILFDVMLHTGTLIAVFIAFWTDIKRLFIEMLCIVRDIFLNIKIYLYNKKEDDAKRYHKILQNNYRKFAILIFISTIATTIVALVVRNLVVKAAASLLASGIGLLITGVALLVVDYTPSGKKVPLDVTFKTALIIGVFQGISAFPGISRSGVTIAACLLCGLHKKFSVKYSFIMSIPVILGAAIWQIPQITVVGISWLEGLYYAAGAAIAAGVGFFCIKKMLTFIQKQKFKIFSFYCFVIGILSIVYNFSIK